MKTESTIDKLLQDEEAQTLPFSIKILNLSPRVRHSLSRGGIHTIGELIKHWNTIPEIRNIGTKGILEIRDRLELWYLEGGQAILLNGTPMHSNDQAVERLLSEDQLINEQALDYQDDLSNIPIEVLNLSVRAYNSLKRRNINTVDQIYQQWDQICLFKHVGTMTRAEIRTALASFRIPGDYHKVADDEMSPANVTVASKEHASPQKGDSLVVNPIDQLQISDRAYRLLKMHSMHSIDQITPAKLRELKSRKVLTWRDVKYIQRAIEIQSCQSESEKKTELEIAEEQKISIPPEELDFEDFFHKLLGVLSSRYISIIEFRFGLKTGRVVTLQETAEHLGITRSRAQQIEMLALQKLRVGLNELSRSTLIVKMKESIERRGGFISESRLVDELNTALRSKTYSMEGILMLVKKLFKEEIRISHTKTKLEYMPTLRGWSTNSWDQEQILMAADKILDILSKSELPVQWADLYGALLRKDGLIALDEHLAHAIAIGMSDNQRIQRQMDGGWFKRGKSTRYGRIIAIMREIGEPAHFSQIAERYDQIYNDQPLSEHNIHGILSGREEFVRVGRGKYGLREWGLHDDGNIANAVRRILISHNRPMELPDITSEVLKTWEVSIGSIIAAIDSDARFSKTEDERIWLTEWGLSWEKRTKRDDENRADRIFGVLKDAGRPLPAKQIVEVHNKAHPERPLTIASAKYLMNRKKELFTYIGSERFALAEWELEAIENLSRDRKKEIIDIINEYGPIHINDLYELYNQKYANSPISRNTLNMYLRSLRHLLTRPQRGVYDLRALESEIG